MLLEKADLLKLANKWWNEILANTITGHVDFPKSIEIPIPKPNDIKYKHSLIQNNQHLLQELSQDERNFRTKTSIINYRDSGSQTLITSIHFDTINQYLTFTGNVKNYKIFTLLIKDILTKVPQLKNYIIQKPSMVLEHEVLWPDLLKILSYFLENPKPMVYLRTLPIGVHTKFMEDNKKIIDQLLTNILPKNSINNEISGLSNYGFEKRYGLLYEKKLVRMKLLDKNLAIQCALTDITALPSELNKLNIACSNIFIVENKMTFLSFPDINASLVFFGAGYAVSELKEISWIKNKNIYYWGDIDAQGFEILSQLRHHFPHAKSMLMSKIIFQKYNEFVVNGTPSNINTSLLLQPDEQLLYDLIKQSGKRLEQEHIPHFELLDALKTLL